MDLRQLTALVAVADHGTFSAAAKALHTVQSNISAHVARLERELGVTLVDRSRAAHRGGRGVVGRARRIQGELDAIAADMASLRQRGQRRRAHRRHRHHRPWLVPRSWTASASDHPRVHAVVVDATTTSLLAPARCPGTLDLAVVNLPVDDPELGDRAAVRRGPGARRAPRPPAGPARRVTLAELADHRLLLEPPGHRVPRRARGAGGRGPASTLEPQAEVDGVRLVASLAFQGFGAADRAGDRGAGLASRALAAAARAAACAAAGRAGPGAAACLRAQRPRGRRHRARWSREPQGADQRGPARWPLPAPG